MLEAWVNRRDCFGAYKRNGSQFTCKDPLDDAVIGDHFAGKRVIGLHTTSLENTCRWVCWDIDAHDGESEEQNHAVATTLAQRLDADGFAPLIEDSDGRGGRHVWVHFSTPVPAADAYAMARYYCPEGAEAFPKQARINPEPGKAGHYGNWVRVPGKHHKRAHWSRFWSGFDWIDFDAEMLDDLRFSPAPVMSVSDDAPASKGRGEGTEPLPISDDDWRVIIECLPKIGPPYVDEYESWLKVGLAIHHCKPSLRGLAEWDDWSKQSKKYEPDACMKKWQTFGAAGTHPNPVGVGTLMRWAGMSSEASERSIGVIETVMNGVDARGSGDVSDEERTRILEGVSGALGVRIIDWIKRGTEEKRATFHLVAEHPHRTVVMEAGVMPEIVTVCIGGGAAVMSLRSFAAALLESRLNHAIPPGLSKGWQGTVVRSLSRIVKEIAVPDDTAAAELEEVIDAYLADTRCGAEFTPETAKANLPFYHEGRLYISAPHVSRWMRREGIRLERFKSRLGEEGWTREKINVPGSSRSYYWREQRRAPVETVPL